MNDVNCVRNYCHRLGHICFVPFIKTELFYPDECCRCLFNIVGFMPAFLIEKKFNV